MGADWNGEASGREAGVRDDQRVCCGRVWGKACAGGLRACVDVWMCGWCSSEGPAERPYIPFEGRSTAQDAYQPKLLDEGPTFGGRPGLGQEAQAVRPYIPFEGESVTKSSYP